MKNRLESIVFSSNQQKVLDFLLRNPGEQFYDRQIAHLTGLSKSGTNLALRQLAESELVLKTKRGRMNFYRLDSELPLAKCLKIAQNLIVLSPLAAKLKSTSLKVVLFGSGAQGENTSQSDIDLFILTREPEKVGRILMKEPLRERIRAIIKSPQKYATFKKDNQTLYREISKGIILWQEA